MKHIIIDGNCYLSISMYRSMSNLQRDSPDRLDELIVGSTRKLFFQMLKKLSRELGEFNEYYVVWDHPQGSAWRKTQLADYKGNRNHASKLRECLDAGKQIVDELVMMNLEVHEAEADDAIFALADLLREGVTVVSRDQDMIQIVQRGYAERVFDPVLRKDMPIPEYDIVLYKSICGDSSDNISGLYKHGPAKALKMLKEGLTLEQEAAIAPFKLIIDIPSNPNYARIRDDVSQALLKYQKELEG